MQLHSHARVHLYVQPKNCLHHAPCTMHPSRRDGLVRGFGWLRGWRASALRLIRSRDHWRRKAHVCGWNAVVTAGIRAVRHELRTSRARQHEAGSYQELVLVMFGEGARQCVQWIVILFNFTGNIASLQVISSQAAPLLSRMPLQPPSQPPPQPAAATARRDLFGARSGGGDTSGAESLYTHGASSMKGGATSTCARRRRSRRATAAGIAAARSTLSPGSALRS